MALKENRLQVFIRVVLGCLGCEKRLPVLMLGPPYAGYWSYEADGQEQEFAKWTLPTTTFDRPANYDCWCGDCRPEEA